MAEMRVVIASLVLSLALTGCYGPSAQIDASAQKPIALWEVDLALIAQEPGQRVRLTSQIEHLRARGWINSIGIVDSHNEAMQCGSIDSLPMPDLPAQHFPVQVSRFDANTCSGAMALCARGSQCSVAPGCPRLWFEAPNDTWRSVHSFDELHALSTHAASAMPDCYGLGGGVQARDCVDTDLVEARRVQNVSNLSLEVRAFIDNVGEPDPPDLHLPADEARYLLTVNTPKDAPSSVQSQLLLRWPSADSPTAVALAWTDNWPDPRQIPEQQLALVSTSAGWNATANASRDEMHALLRQSAKAPPPEAQLEVRIQREMKFDHSDYWFTANGTAPYRVLLFASGSTSCASRSPTTEIARLAAAGPESWQPATLGTLEELPVPATTQTQQAMPPDEREWRRWLKIAIVAWLLALGAAIGFRL